MRVKIAARHCNPDEAVRERAEEQLRRLSRFDSSLTAAELVFKEEKRSKAVEGILHVPGAQPIVAEGEGDDFNTAVDRLVGRLGRILRRHRSQKVDHKGPRHAGTESMVGD